MIYRWKQQSAQHERSGVTAVEFAICAPVFFLVVLACFEFSWLQVVRHTADNAAYEAVRHVVVPGATASEASTRCQQLMDSVGAKGVTITITPTAITSATESVTVRVDVPMNQNSLTIGKFTANRNMTSTATMKTERGD